MSRDRSSPGGTNRYDAILDKVVDTEKVNLETIRNLTSDYVKTKCPSYTELITDLIMEYLKSERFPDPKVMQCELSDYGFFSLSNTKRLMRHLWNDLLKEQDNSRHSSKYQKISSSSGSTTKLSTSNTSDDHRDKRYSGHGYHSHSYHNQQASQL